MERKLHDDVTLTKLPRFVDHDTWNECPECHYCWKSKTPVPRLLHRIRTCRHCIKRMREK